MKKRKKERKPARQTDGQTDRQKTKQKRNKINTTQTSKSILRSFKLDCVS